MVATIKIPHSSLIIFSPIKTFRNRQVARDLARQAAKNAREEEAREAAQWELEREQLQAHESQADNFHALQLARQALRKWQASVQHAKALRQEQQEREERLHQAAKMERLREGVLLVRFYVLFIMGVKERVGSWAHFRLLEW